MGNTIRLLLIIVLAFTLRVFTAGWGGLSCDEANCANTIEADWPSMLRHIILDGNAPLYYVLVKVWSIVFGKSDFALRLFSVILSTALPLTAFSLMKSRIGTGQAMQIAILLCLCAPLVQFGNLVRPYALLPILSLASTVLLMDMLGGRKGFARTALYGLSLAAMVYTHHWGAMVAAGHAVLALSAFALRRISASCLGRWLAGAAIAFCLYAPWLFVVVFQLGSDVSPWITTPGLDELLFLSPVEAVSGYRERPEWLHWWTVAFANLAVWASLLLPSRLPAPSAALPPFIARRWQVVAAGALVAGFAVSQIRSLWRDRYLMAVTPLLIVLYSVTASRMADRAGFRAAKLLPVVAWLPIWLPQIWFFHSLPESSAWAMVEQIGREMNPERDLVVVSFEAIAPQVDRYLPARARVVSFPDLERVSVIPWAGINGRIREQQRLERLTEMMEATLQESGDVWLVESYHKYVPIPLRFPLTRLDFNAVEAVRMCQIRFWLESKARKIGQDLWAPGREFSVMASRFSR